MWPGPRAEELTVTPVVGDILDGTLPWLRKGKQEKQTVQDSQPFSRSDMLVSHVQSPVTGGRERQDLAPTPHKPTLRATESRAQLWGSGRGQAGPEGPPDIHLMEPPGTSAPPYTLEGTQGSIMAGESELPGLPAETLDCPSSANTAPGDAGGHRTEAESLMCFTAPSM